MKIAVIVLVSLFSFMHCVKLPKEFMKCNRKQSDFKECVLKAAQDGIPKLKQQINGLSLQSLEPYNVPEATIGSGDGPVSVTQKFFNCKFYGFSDLKLEKFEFNFEEKTLTVVGVEPLIRKLCNYDMKGKVLLIPVNGRGNSTIVLKNLKVSNLMKYEEKKKNGKTFMKFVSNVMTLEPEHVSYEFINQEDTRLSEHINPVLNENWKEVFDDVKSGYSELLGKIIVQIFNGFFGKISMEEAFD